MNYLYVTCTVYFNYVDINIYIDIIQVHWHLRIITLNLYINTSFCKWRRSISSVGAAVHECFSDNSSQQDSA